MTYLPEPSRLALFLPDMGGGGAERVALALMEGFLERGFSVDLVLADRRGPLLELVPDGVDVFDLGAPRQRQALWPLVHYLRDRRPFALHAMMWPTPLVAVIARSLAGVQTRIVAAEHTTLSTMPHGLRHPLMRALTRRAYLKADALAAVSAGAADDMAEFLGLPRMRIAAIHNPLLLPTRLPSSEEASGEWPAGTRRILAVGEFKVEKNYPLLLEAFDRVRRIVPASLLILGEGALLHDVRRMAESMALDDALVFAGFHNDIWPFYAAADLFVLSSDYEGFGNVLIEAMHAGVPVVSTDCPSGPREILADGRYGTLVPCGDASALAEAMATALTRTPDRAASRARAASLSGEEPIDRHLALMLGSRREA